MADRAPHRAVPELQGGIGLRSATGRAALRLLRIARAGSLRRDQVTDPAAESSAVPRRRYRGARADPPVVQEQVAGAERAEVARARRYGEGDLHSLLDLRRAGRLSMGRGGGALLLHDGVVSR